MKLSSSRFPFWKPLDPLVSIRAMVKTWMSCRIIAGLLASGTRASAALGSKAIVDYGGILLVLFKRTTDDAHIFFVYHGRDSFLSLSPY